jgi:hypothetical protein
MRALIEKTGTGARLNGHACKLGVAFCEVLLGRLCKGTIAAANLEGVKTIKARHALGGIRLAMSTELANQAEALALEAYEKLSASYAVAAA